VVFNALASRDHQLEGLIVNGEHTFHAASEASQQFADAFRVLPDFERNSRKALQELDSFAEDATPFLEEFQTPERKLSALLAAAKPFAPQFDQLLTSLGPLTKAAKVGLPDLGKSLKLTEPILENLRPVLHNLDPFLQYTGTYVREVQAFFGNLTSASEFQASNGDLPESVTSKQHLLSTLATLNPESLAVYAGKVGTNRPNAYPLAGTYNSIPTGLPVFSTAGCANEAPAVNGPPNETVTESLILKLIKFKVVNRPETFSGFKPTGNPATEKELAEAEGVPAGTNQVAAPGCVQQGPNSFNGKLSQFPHVVYEGK
jgi:ABC-type transporter Mla subunit MlaD